MESFSLAPWTSRRRQELLELLDRLDPMIDTLSKAIEQEEEGRPEVQRLMTHPGVGPITALAFVLIIGTPERFHCGRQIASYLGLIPCEDSSADQRRLGHITKQGNVLMRFLLGEAAHAVAHREPEWRQHYFHLLQRRGRAIATVALARKLAVRLFWMWRKGQDYQQVKKFGSNTGQPEVLHGVKSITAHLIGRPAPSGLREFELVNHGRSFDRIDGWVEPSSPE